MATVIFRAESVMGSAPTELDGLTGTFGVMDVKGATLFLFGYVSEIVLQTANDCVLTPATTTLPRDTDPPFPPVWPRLFSTDVLYGRDHLNLQLTMVRGDTYSFNIAITQDGDPFNLTGYTLTMTAKWNVRDTGNVFQLTSPASGIIITDAVNGLATVTVSPSNTSSLPPHVVDLRYDIQASSGSTIYTPIRGILRVLPDVTV